MTPTLSRVQLALNVADLSAAIEFYSKLFATLPAKQYAGYANFEIADPPLKLVLFENPQAAQTLNHLGIEVEQSEQVTAICDRWQAAQLAVQREAPTTCCYAMQDKAWVIGVDHPAWEVYTVLEQAETLSCHQSCC